MKKKYLHKYSSLIVISSELGASSPDRAGQVTQRTNPSVFKNIPCSILLLMYLRRFVIILLSMLLLLETYMYMHIVHIFRQQYVHCLFPDNDSYCCYYFLVYIWKQLKISTLFLFPNLKEIAQNKTFASTFSSLHFSPPCILLLAFRMLEIYSCKLFHVWY